MSYGGVMCHMAESWVDSINLALRIFKGCMLPYSLRGDWLHWGRCCSKNVSCCHNYSSKPYHSGPVELTGGIQGGLHRPVMVWVVLLSTCSIWPCPGFFRLVFLEEAMQGEGPKCMWGEASVPPCVTNAPILIRGVCRQD
jgi:hypothetical protein